MREDDISYRKQPPARRELAPTGVTVTCLVGATSSLRSASFGNVPVLFDRDLEVAPTGITLLIQLSFTLCSMPYALCSMRSAKNKLPMRSFFVHWNKP